MEEGEEVGVRSVCCTGEKEQGWAEPEAGSEAGLKTAPSGLDRATPEAEVWGSGGARSLGNGQEKKVKGWGAALWGSEGQVWVPWACLSAGCLDSAPRIDLHRRLHLVVDWKAEREDQESRAVQEEMDSRHLGSLQNSNYKQHVFTKTLFILPTHQN